MSFLVDPNARQPGRAAQRGARRAATRDYASAARSNFTGVEGDRGSLGRTLSSWQAAAGNAAVQRVLDGHLQRKALGTQVTQPAGLKSKFKTIAATFDGTTFDVDGAPLLTAPAQSGRPYTVSKSDAKACKGSPDDSYMNNPRYVGIKDNGPIPEGEYRFLATDMTTFSAAEQAQMLLGGNYTDPRGVTLHGGDWGAGRVGLVPVRVLPSKYCGNTAARSGFFPHGGVMPGSSGCIDIGDSAFSALVKHLLGYRSVITVTVRYTNPPPEVGALDRAAGRFMYPGRGKLKDPSLWDRLGSLFGDEEE